MATITPQHQERLLKKVYLTTSEVCQLTGEPPHTISFWRKEFPTLSPSRRCGRIYFSQDEVKLVLEIQSLLKQDGLSISDARLRLAKKQSPSSAIRKQEQNSHRRKQLTAGMQPLPEEQVLSVKKIMDICRVHERTAQRYLSTGKAPYSVCRLLHLSTNGRILPDTWNHCFINTRSNLEIYQVGEVSENEVLNMRWAKQIYSAHIQAAENKLATAEARIEQLESMLNELSRHKNLLMAANDEIH